MFNVKVISEMINCGLRVTCGELLFKKKLRIVSYFLRLAVLKESPKESLKRVSTLNFTSCIAALRFGIKNLKF